MIPILIITYIRLDHLKQTINSLEKNIYAEETDLYIASDYQKNDLDTDKVNKVRRYLKTVKGFKSVTLFEREENFGPSKNFFSAVEILFRKHENVIIMEEDIITAPGFLKFINEVFEIYGGNERFFSISGYCPPIKIPSSYQYDVFFLGRMSAWGCALSKDRYKSVLNISREEFDKFSANKKWSRAFVKSGGKDLLVMLKNVAYGLHDTWDVRCMYTQFINKQYTVYPTQSLVLNIGHDGTGIHCGKSDRFDVPLSNKTSFRFPEDPFIDNRIVQANYNFRNCIFKANTRVPFTKKIGRLINRLLA